MSNVTRNAENEFNLVSAIPFIIFHLAIIGIFFTGFTTTSVILAVALYFIRMWAVTGVYHRYFSHKSYSTSRVFQFILAFLAQTSAQQGVIWWANHHRRHHQYSDTENDVHSPRQRGFWYAHVGWIFTKEYCSREYTHVNDWLAYPELKWLDKHRYLPAISLGVLCWLIDGWAGLFVGFVLSTIVCYHFTFFINSLAHVYGKQRYLTGDDSRNNWWLALLNLGEGWHNNHHHYSTCARQGFRWWEVDITYYVIKILEKVRLVWDVKEPPEHIVKGLQTVPQRVKERTWPLFNPVSINFNDLSSNVTSIAQHALQMVEQPTQQLTQNINTMVAQVKLSLADTTNSLETLPPKVAAIVKERLSILVETMDNTLKSLAIKEHLQHYALALEKMAFNLQLSQLIPDRIPAKST